MSSKRRRQSRESAGRAGSGAGRRPEAKAVASAPRSGAGPDVNPAVSRRARIGVLIAAMVVVTVVAIGAELVFSTLSKNSSGGSGSPRQTATAGHAATAGQTATAASSPSQFGVVVQGNGGHWTNVTPDQLATMLDHKDFTLINVRTTDSGIEGTDLYIAYDQVAASAAKLPGDKGAKILVYCRTGTTSKIAAQALLDLGYTNVWNLAGGMEAWTASGRKLINPNQ